MKEPVGLVKLVGPRSWTMFNMLNMSSEDMEWLQEDASTWILRETYRTFVSFTKGLQVVNDPAERGIKIIEDFIHVSKDEALRQDLILAVSEHRKNHSLNMTKKSLDKL